MKNYDNEGAHFWVQRKGKMHINQILILYHVKEREEIISEILANHIRTRKLANEVIVGEFYAVCQAMYKYAPDVVVSIMPRDKYSADYLTLMKFVYNCCIIAMPTEGLMNLDRESMQRLVGYNSYSENLIDTYFFWGAAMAEKAGRELIEQKKVISLEQIKVFGYLPYEKQQVCKYFRVTEEINKMINVKEQKRKIVLFVMGFHNADITLQERIDEGYFKDFSEKEIQAAKKKSRANKYYKIKYLEALKYCIEENPNIFFVLKLHPVEIESMVQKGENTYQEFECYSNVLILADTNPIAAYFDKIDCIVHYGSTVGMEAYIYKIPMIQLMNDYCDMSAGGMGLKYFDSTKEIDVSDKEMLSNILRDELVFTRSKYNDIYLKEMMNYSLELDYTPGETVCDYIERNEKTLVMGRKDRYVKRMLKGKTYLLLQRHFLRKLIENLFLDRNNFRRIVLFEVRLFNNFLR